MTVAPAPPVRPRRSALAVQPPEPKLEAMRRKLEACQPMRYFRAMVRLPARFYQRELRHRGLRHRVAAEGPAERPARRH